MSASCKQPVFEVNLQNQATKETLSARVYAPEEEPPSDIPGAAPVWFAAFHIDRGGVSTKRQGGGVDWLQALMMAIEGVQRTIPEGEEDVWRDAAGVPSWQLIPRRVPINNGYEFYRRVCDVIDAGRAGNS